MAESDTGQAPAAQYEIRLKGNLPDQWKEWFGGMTIHCDSEGNTILSGKMNDPADLHGLLVKVRDLGIPLLSLIRLSESNALDGEI
jgi:hypothetical protein